MMNKIRELRLSQGMKQTELADLMNVTAMTISRYERNEADPDVATICKLCDVFGCTADYLLGRAAVPSPELTEDEQRLLLAYRAAPDEIREIVDVALKPYVQEAATAAS